MNSFPLKQFYPLASVNTSYKIILARLNYFFNLELKYIFEVNLRTGFNFYFSTLEYGRPYGVEIKQFNRSFF